MNRFHQAASFVLATDGTGSSAEGCSMAASMGWVGGGSGGSAGSDGSGSLGLNLARMSFLALVNSSSVSQPVLSISASLTNPVVKSSTESVLASR